MAAPITATGGAEGDSGQHIDAPELRLFVMALFFIFGGITSLNDVIIPKLKELFTLNYTEAMLVQFCFFTAYAVIGIPGAALVKRIGYMRGAVVGLLTMMVGCLLFIPASRSAAYPLFLFAFFILASGVVVVQVVTNPLISLLGPAKTTSSRLTFAQAFNSLGTVVFPKVGSTLILGSLAGVTAAQLSGAALDDYRMAETQIIAKTYIGLAVALVVVAGAVWMNRNRLKHDANSEDGAPLVTLPRFLMGLGVFALGALAAVFGYPAFSLPLMLAGIVVWLYHNRLLTLPRFSFGALCIFLYVGAEVAIGSLIVNYLQQKSVLGVDAETAGSYIPYYWGGALIGRFIGSWVMTRVSPGKVLAFNGIGAIVLVLISMNTTGATSAWSLLAVGLMNSIMFPTIFSLACEGLGSKAADGSGIINIAIFGGAVIPVLTGKMADMASLSTSLILPIACYAIIAVFGWWAAGRNATPA
ncbi:MAG: sugar MFS transporter [Novosphingobium sp.]